MSDTVDERREVNSTAGAVPRTPSKAFPLRLCSLVSAQSSLALLGVACCFAVIFANLRHTGSLSFPIDDGFIYSNYALSAAHGNFFSYNAGVQSGGVTSLGWYALCTLFYWLLAPFHDFLGGLPPAGALGDLETARQAGQLYLAAYIPAILCFMATGVGVYRLALLALPPLKKNRVARNAICWLTAAATLANTGLLWGTMSGLEIPLSTSLAVWSIVLLIVEVRRGALRWSLLLAASLPWARPDLLAISAAAFLWLLWRAVRGPVTAVGSGEAYRNVVLYLAAAGAGTAAMSAVYLAGWGRPFPSSFYAKVGGLRLGSKFWVAGEQLISTRGNWPFVAVILAAAGGLLQWLVPTRTRPDRYHDNLEGQEAASSALLLFMIALIYIFSIMVTLPWFGQEERYLLPAYPFVTLLLGLLVWRLVEYLPLDGLLNKAVVRRAGAAAVALALVVVVYLWSTRLYVVEVRNITDAHILPSVWISENTPPDSLIAAEPIGAVKLFSHRRTFDIIGLTSPASLGSFRDWPRSWEIVRQAGANYLFYYPGWFDGPPPGWAVEMQRFSVPDNHIAGADVIAVYQLRWDLYKPLSP